MTIAFDTFLKESKTFVEEKLVSYANELQCPNVLREAMAYSLEAGGKRLRPLLLFATLQAFGKERNLGVGAACALEMIHTYSLVHDDLPCMDDDDLRRGKPTNHKVFGEAMAVLAGDGLLTYAFQIVMAYEQKEISAEKKVRLVLELAKAAGPEGMVGGQVADMEAEGKQLTIDELEYIHKHKTGKLLEFAVLAGAILSNATKEQEEKLLEFAKNIGLAFQIRDDILDVEGTEEEIGKPIGSDVSNEKSTYTTLFTVDRAKNILEETIAKAKDAISSLQLQDEYLLSICDLIAKRNN
ncbi:MULTISPECIES: (2E,6E)-farnesyl diphosphate synthase [Bacillus]|uniref:Farnesyl diphosphate synthase n=1 Tax=Bacillus toyonensis TaxID=155322 RepID=A0A1X3MNA3_9BACI|nr:MULTISPECIES: (2E,6E)-farnesyl diphosphate synthase [Bacillus]EEL32895.1 Geranyltranstransferase [Bacillus cereus Rock3-28]EEL38667.1 Geranyltranstransferase [Bacillus cereus Rock3-29]EEL59398.1 WbbF [Bacillus cereus Rock4-18]EOP22458.1 geranylgeranyl diphosphate synthase, type II [Bacillus cereus VD131]KAB0446446.1 polyprenyl synthetase family protein [Lysinibacillus sp. VIA-II-2016]KNH39860.1 farnesyl-diphosphate synthase [Bacillus thuringiensis]KXY48770.1 farnesyl-diphosphate synthase 